MAHRLHPIRCVMTASIHRVIEQHAATRGNLPAVVDGTCTISYRELNATANAVARHLMAAGFRRSGHATVRMPRGVDLAITLLAVLKAGGAYTWDDPDRHASPMPIGVSFSTGVVGSEEQYLHLDLAPVLRERLACSPNLPVLTRGTDVACILRECDGSPAVIVPHATIAALRSKAVPHPTPWVGDAGAFELWMALMAGTTAIVEEQGAAVAAA